MFGAAADHGTNCIEEAVERGMEMLIGAGQWSIPVAMPMNERLQSTRLVARLSVDQWTMVTL